MRLIQTLSTILLAAATGAQAAPDAVVDAVRAPAWLERGGHSAPLTPGTTLSATDRIRTGADSRVYLKLAEGSTVKLGENAALSIDGLRQRKDGVFAAALNVVQGAFRFTTDVVSRGRQREVSIRVATVTAGIRGTDLWGKSDKERDLVCLLEGRIEVSHASGARTTMDQPLSFYVAPRGQAPLPVASVDPKQLAQWSRETEIDAGTGAARRGGKWKVVLFQGSDEDAAFAAYGAARKAGLPAELHPAIRAGKRSWDVLVRQLPDEREAKALAERAGREWGLTGARPSR